MTARFSLSPRRHSGRAIWYLLLGLTVGGAVDFSLQAQLRPKAAPAPGIALRPRLDPGQVKRYQIQFQTISETRRGGVVQDPQGPSRLVVTWDATVRLEVVGEAAAPDAIGKLPKSAAANKSRAESKPLHAAPMRIRTTYERSVAMVTSDTPEPQAEEIEKQYANLQGRVIEFTLGSDGRVSNVTGLEAISTGEQSRQAAEQWVAQLSIFSEAPPSIAPGQNWSSQKPAGLLPLAGLIWRSDSSYVRDESCRPADPADVSTAPPEICAVVLTRESLSSPRALRDPTPEEYRRNGVRTSGHWTGSGESLTYVSLQNGWTVSITQNSAQEIDLTALNASGTSIRYAGTVETHSRVLLLPSEAAALP
jgi:hypothetical protein